MFFNERMLNGRLAKHHSLVSGAVFSTAASPFTGVGAQSPHDPHPVASITSKDELLRNYAITPPVTPWPLKLYPERLVSIIKRQPSLDLALRAFEFAGEFHPGFSHTCRTYGALIARLARARQFHRVETLLSQLKCSGIKCHDDAIFITVIRNYGLAHRSRDAFRTFLRIKDFGVSWSVRSLNCLLDVLVRNREYDWVYLLFKNYKGKFGLMPDVISCNILVKALSRKGDMSTALKVLDEMAGMGVVPNLVTYTTLLVGFVQCDDLPGAKRVFEEIRDRGLVPDVTAYTVMVSGYCKKGRLVDAVRIMDEMEDNGIHPNDVTYVVMIEAYCEEMKSGEAVNLLTDMLNKHHFPSPALCCKVIDLLCQEDKVEDACVLWKELLKKNVSRDNAISCTLIHWLCKKGKIWEAKELFDELEKGSAPSLFIYNALISGMCEAGEFSEAARLWDDMVQKKCMPNSFTYNMLIKGFCAMGNPKEGMRLLEEMLGDGCLPNDSTFSILIDGLLFSGMGAEIDSLLSLVSNSGGRIDSKSWEVILNKAASIADTTSMLDGIILDSVA